MLGLMKYELGLRFTGIVFENEKTAEKWLKENGWVNKNAYKLIPISFVCENLEVK
jgi:hypothetical protein